MNDSLYTSRQRRGLLGATLSQTIVATANLALAPLAILLQTDFALSRAELGLLLSAGATGALVSALPAGWLSDVLGVRRVVTAALLWGALTFGAVALAPSLPLALFCAFLSGLGMGVISPATTKAIMYWFSARVRGTAMGIKQTGYALGGALSAAILPSLALAFGGWRPAVLAVGAVSVLVGGLFYWLYAEHPQQKSLALGQPAGLSTLRGVSTDPRILALAGLAFCYGYIQAVFAGYLALYLQETLFLPIVVAGAILMAGQVSGALGRVGWGLVSDRFFAGRRTPVLFFITAACGVVSLAFGWVVPLLPQWAVVGLVVVFGLVAVGWSGLYHVFVGETAGREKAGTAAGLCLMVGAAGTVVGPPLFGFIVDTTNSYPLAWSTPAVVSALGLVTIAWLRRSPER
ncbi:MAG: MFS transporter [Chloroflexota bacterium]